MNDTPIITDDLTITVTDDENNPLSGAIVSVEEKVYTGTVTVTCQYGSGSPIKHATVGLHIGDEPPFAGGDTDSDGTVTLETLNEAGQPTGTVADVPYGDYVLTGHYYDELTHTHYHYDGPLTVDSDEEITIKL